MLFNVIGSSSLLCKQVRYPYHVRVLVPCYKESLEILRRTIMAAYDAQLPEGCHRTIYLCDDGKDPKKRKWVDSLAADVVYVSGRKRLPGKHLAVFACVVIIAPVILLPPRILLSPFSPIPTATSPIPAPQLKLIATHYPATFPYCIRLACMPADLAASLALILLPHTSPKHAGLLPVTCFNSFVNRSQLTSVTVETHLPMFLQVK